MALVTSIGKFFRGFMNNFINFVNTISTTNLRIIATMLFVFIYLVTCLITKTSPEAAWLTFFGAMAGLDVAQFTSKRITTKNMNGNTMATLPVVNVSTIPQEMSPSLPPVVSEEEGDLTTDVQELRFQSNSQKG